MVINGKDYPFKYLHLDGCGKISFLLTRNFTPQERNPNASEIFYPSKERQPLPQETIDCDSCGKNMRVLWAHHIQRMDDDGIDNEINPKKHETEPKSET